MAKTVQARVLVDNGSFGLRVDQVVEGSDKAVKALAAAGVVDPHPDAVAYALAQKCVVVTLPPEVAAALV